MDDPQLLNCLFEVVGMDEDGKKFDRVSRLVCVGVTENIDVTVDINCEVYKVKTGDKLKMVLCTTLDKDGGEDSEVYDQSGNPTLLDNYDYAMHGKVFHFDYGEPSDKQQKVSVYISYGGLLMKITSLHSHVSKIKKDQRLYCLLRKEVKEVTRRN